MLLTDLHQMHARHLAALRRSPATIAFYFFALDPLLDVLEEQGVAPDADLITLPLLHEFQLWLRGSGGPAAVRARLPFQAGHEARESALRKWRPRGQPRVRQ
ncbi:hypothetical protein [Deinococcus navajonensis]|uniref:Uncharacterized protein n=1 Tax=Deinococcus navajonensis TaxID=309884 RepID=A0ABV8XKI9_9DEIO